MSFGELVIFAVGAGLILRFVGADRGRPKGAIGQEAEGTITLTPKETVPMRTADVIHEQARHVNMDVDWTPFAEQMRNDFALQAWQRDIEEEDVLVDDSQLRQLRRNPGLKGPGVMTIPLFDSEHAEADGIMTEVVGAIDFSKPGTVLPETDPFEFVDE